MSFEVGDVVQLKSGGPPMTVTKAGLHWIETKWFLPSGNGPRGDSFAPEVLEQYKGREPLYSARPGHFPPKPFPYNPYPD